MSQDGPHADISTDLAAKAISLSTSDKPEEPGESCSANNESADLYAQFQQISPEFLARYPSLDGSPLRLREIKTQHQLEEDGKLQRNASLRGKYQKSDVAMVADTLNEKTESKGKVNPSFKFK